MARNEEPNVPVNAEVSDAAISPDLESSVQSALDDTFGGVDDASLDRESSGGRSRASKDTAGDDGSTTVVREHRRRITKRGSNDQRKGWVEEQAGEEVEEGDETGGASTEASEAAEVQEHGTQPGEKPGQGEAPGQGPAAKEPTGDDAIPPHLIEAARRRGWSEDRIQRLVKADPDLAFDTFDQLHQDANELSTRYAEMGRMLAGQTGQHIPQANGQPPAQFPGQAPGQQGGVQNTAQPTSPQQGQAGGQQQGLLPAFKFAEEVTKDLDEDFRKGVLDSVAGHLNQINDVINNVVGQHQGWIQERQREVLFQQVDQFFDGRKDYNKLYGAGDRSSLEPDQMALRQRVVEQADAIRAGAMYQGRQLTVHEALEMAHNLVTSKHQKETARREIQGQVRKRNGQITVRPTHRSGAPENSRDPLSKATSTAARKLRELNATTGL